MRCGYLVMFHPLPTTIFFLLDVVIYYKYKYIPNIKHMKL
jgi:hypothetical protein